MNVLSQILTFPPFSPTVSTSTPSNPTGTASATAVMMGLAGSFTPTNTGKMLLIINGTCLTSIAGDGGTVQIAYGTGGAPINGAAATGTTLGAVKSLIIGTTTGRVSFSCSYVATGLILHTTYWIDLQTKATTGGTFTIQDIEITAIELSVPHSISSPSNPTGTTSTTSLMMGLAGSFTPRTTGRMLLIITGGSKNTSATSGVSISVKTAFGTGGAPANAAAATGTLLGSTYVNIPGSVATQGFCRSYIATGLTLGTSYWIDLQVSTSNANGTASVSGIDIVAIELNNRTITTSAGSSPTGTASATPVMMGLAGSFTPTSTGRLLLIITGSDINSVAVDGTTVQLAFGTGTAPINGAAATGTTLGALQHNVYGANVNKANFLCAYIATGLTLNTTYWLDLQSARITAGTSTLSVVDIVGIEI